MAHNGDPVAPLLAGDEGSGIGGVGFQEIDCGDGIEKIAGFGENLDVASQAFLDVEIENGIAALPIVQTVPPGDRVDAPAGIYGGDAGIPAFAGILVEQA